MREITKGPEPPSLTAHREKLHSDYENYAAKNDLRHALVTEQRGLCCYCMGQISPNASAMKIEHWQCQARYPNRQLNYCNLLGACLGGEDQKGQKRKALHCDTRKGNRDLKWNPAEPAHHIETRVKYEPDGSIHAHDADFDEQINGVLNLNLVILKNRRRSVLDGVLEWLEGNRSAPRHRIEQKIDEYATGDGQLTPYCQVAVWWLNWILNQMP